MSTTYIPITISAKEGPVALFDVDCVAEIEYETNRRDGLTDWRVTDFRFDQVRSAYDATASQWIYTKISEVWCSDELRPLLMKYLDRRDLEERLVSHLIDEGEVCFSNGSVAADYRASVL